MDPLTEESASDGLSNSPPKGHEEAADASPRPVHEEHNDFVEETPSTYTIGAHDEELIEEPISVDSNDDDSAIGDLSRLSSTTSARASVFNYVQENGRTYHRYRQGKYMLPNDEIEQDRLDMQHQLWLITLHDQLSLAPVKENPHHVLDIGTGTGIWAIDYALEHPSAAVIGSDLSPIQPSFVPVNCSFEVDDFEDEWVYEQKFDLVHGRMLLSCFNNPKGVFEQAFKSLARGGWFEMQDADFPARCADNSYAGSTLEKWNNYIVAGAGAMGRQLTISRHYKRWMEEVGFMNVHERLYRWPISTWPRDPHLKKLGFWFQQDLLEVIGSMKVILTKGLGWSQEQAEVFLVDVRKDVKDRNIHAYHVMYVVFGQKPELT